MSDKRAVCAFRDSLIRHKKAIVLDGTGYDTGEIKPGKEYVLQDPQRTHLFEVVGGPPVSTSRIYFAETGPRYIGDKFCWSIERELKGKIERTPSSESCVISIRRSYGAHTRIPRENL